MTRASPTRWTSSILMVPSRPDTLDNRSLEGRPSSVTLPANAKTAHNGAKSNSELRSQPEHSGVQKSAEMKSTETAPREGAYLQGPSDACREHSRSNLRHSNKQQRLKDQK